MSEFLRPAIPISCATLYPIAYFGSFLSVEVLSVPPTKMTMVKVHFTRSGRTQQGAF